MIRQLRMDFKIEILKFDDETREIEGMLIPDPKRYEWKDIKGERKLYDKFDNIYFTEQALKSLVEQGKGQFIFYQPSMVNDVGEYLKSRTSTIQENLTGNKTAFTFVDKSKDFLESLEVDKLRFAILCADLVGSTRLSTTIDPERYKTLISAVLFELGEVVPKYRGFVLTYAGDGLIAYFPEPSFITMNDLAFDCALTMRSLVYKTINRILVDNNYPKVDIRIGIDSGESYVITIGSPSSKQHKDIIGSIVSLASKIQTLGASGDVLLGNVTLENIHTTRRGMCEEVILPSSWQYKDRTGELYRVHKIKFR